MLYGAPAMPIYSAIDRTPFTYLVTEKSTGKRYYGSRYAKNCHPSDLGNKYFTSSKEINELVDKYGVSWFAWEIRLICKTVEQTRNLETKILCKIGAAQRNDWFNKSNGNKSFLLLSQTPESLAKGVATKKAKGIINPNTPENRKQAWKTRRKNGKDIVSENTISKQLETKRKNGTMNVMTKDVIEKVIATRKKNGLCERSAECKKKIGDANRGRKRTLESIQKQKDTLKERKGQSLD
jgi:hypothetical protein